MTEGADRPEGAPEAGAEEGSLPADPAAEALARAEREAAEALVTGAFEAGSETQRVRREDIQLEAGLGTHSPLVGADTGEPRASEPLRSPLERLRGTGATSDASTPLETTPGPAAAPPGDPPVLPATPDTLAGGAEAFAPGPAATDPPAAPALDPGAAPTEKFDRDIVKTVEPGAVQPGAPATPATPVVAAFDAPTEIVPPAPDRRSPPRTEEDDRLLAALIFVVKTASDGQSGPPSPFATVGGVSLLKRVAASCKLSNVPRVLLAGELEPGELDKVKGELVEGGWDGPVERWDGGGPPPVGEKGRLLILDASGVHDPEAVARLARWKGERACVLIAPEGDGLRVQVEGNKVREVGTQLVPFDGVTCGAVNVPLPLFPRLSENGALSALISLAQDGLLGASVEHRTFAREIGSETGLSEARQRLVERASGGPHDTFLNRLLVRRISRPLTQSLLPMGVPAVALDAASLVVGLTGAALLTGGGVPPAAALLVGGVLLILASTIFDCAAFELRSFAIQPGGKRSAVHVIPHGLVAAAALAAFGYGSQLLGVEGGQLNGLVAAVGVGIGTALLAFAHWQGGERDRGDPATMGIELLSRRLVNREIGWLLLLLVVGHLVYRLVRPAPVDMPPGHEVLDHGLIGLAALAQAYWVALALFLALQPRKR